MAIRCIGSRHPKALKSRRSGCLRAPPEVVAKPHRCPASPSVPLHPGGARRRSIWVSIRAGWYNIKDRWYNSNRLRFSWSTIRRAGASPGRAFEWPRYFPAPPISGTSILRPSCPAGRLCARNPKSKIVALVNRHVRAFSKLNRNSRMIAGLAEIVSSDQHRCKRDFSIALQVGKYGKHDFGMTMCQGLNA